MPKTISGHQTYFLWGPRNYTGEVVIVVGQPEDEVRKYFDSVEAAAAVNVPYAYSYETLPVLLCRGLKGNLQTLWPRVKN
ncbi:MAG TPA: glycosyltransferase, partial [Terriglobales bacterium]